MRSATEYRQTASKTPCLDTLTVAIRQCRTLPDFVRHASFTYVQERHLSADILAELSSQPAPAADDDWNDRLKRRRERLQPLLGRRLTCVFVRLPGVHYTIEVDASEQKVVHWEWQSEYSRRR